MKQIANAKESLLKAIELNSELKSETHLVLGKIYQSEENFEKAIESYKAFKTLGSDDKEALEDAETLLNQCQNALSLIANPINVEVSNLGNGINSKYEDKNPCITADGSRLVFTTRRPESTNDAVDSEGDGKYFENIYISAYDSTAKNFV